MARQRMIGLGAAAIVLLGLAACSPVTPAVTPEPAPPVALVIDGVYEVTITEEELNAGGVTDPAVVAEQAGTYYWTFDDGTWAYEQQSEHPLEVPGATGSYAIDGSDYTHYWSDDQSVFTTATIQVLPDGSLRFTDIVDGDAAFQSVSEVLFGLHDWVRIGD